MDSSTESASSTNRQQGNISLCRTSFSAKAPITECLVPSHSETIMKATNQNEAQLNWLYEEGLLRSVNSDGTATDLCLGPALETLEGDNIYEMVLQDCPGKHFHSSSSKENIFSRDTDSSTPKSVEPAATAAIAATISESTGLQQRHMRFLIGDTGRIQSLAPVYKLEDPGKDFVVEQPFCLTTRMVDPNDNISKAYLVPCLLEDDENDESTLDYDQEEEEERISLQQQQFFELDERTSFDSFLFNWETKDKDIVRLAYQTGYDGPSSSSKGALDRNNDNLFDSISIRVTSSEEFTKDEPFPVIFDTTVLSTQGTAATTACQSGVLSYPSSSFSISGGMEAHLLGKLETPTSSSVTTLATTAFVVSEEYVLDQTAFSNWPIVHIAFWAFIISYALFVMIHKTCFPNSPQHNWKSKRDSEFSIDNRAATMSSHNRNHEWIETFSEEMVTSSNNRQRILLDNTQTTMVSNTTSIDMGHCEDDSDIEEETSVEGNEGWQR